MDHPDSTFWVAVGQLYGDILDRSSAATRRS